MSGLHTVSHLARRWAGSLSMEPPSPADRRWAHDRLLPGEWELWQRLSAPDQRHSIAVAKAVAEEGRNADGEAPPWLVPAALLHDSGKVVSGMGTTSRVVATVFWAVAPRSLVGRWAAGPGWRGRLADYRRHPELGAELIMAAGGRPQAATWAAEHHAGRDRWTLPTAWASILERCDDD